MKTNDLVSVIIPTYNRANVIGETVDNVLAQTYSNLQVIVVDDGSTDDTAARLRAYGSRLEVIRQDNAGPSAARNRGIEASHGDIIAFQDSDDLWEPSKIARQVSLLQRTSNSVSCCLCNARMLNLYRDGQEHLSFDLSPLHPSHDEGIWLNVTEVLVDRFVLFNQTVAIRRDVLEKIGGFDPGLRYLEDHDLALRLSLEGPWAYTTEPLVIWRGGAANSLSWHAMSNEVLIKECELKIFEGILARVGHTDDPTKLKRQIEARLKIFRRGLITAELSHADFRGAQILGSLLKNAERFHAKVRRGILGFPKMETLPIK